MEREKVYDYLCYRDKRNPVYQELWIDDDNVVAREDKCRCDNCFYGRDKLAVEILRLMEKYEKVELY